DTDHLQEALPMSEIWTPQRAANRLVRVPRFLDVRFSRERRRVTTVEQTSNNLSAKDNFQ
ncbi:MAG: hypothetical protein LBF16_07210, partial [Pseudomonadales bacterium]|nr:hypothetical protein [Pseudomonadales bacterium]